MDIPEILQTLVQDGVIDDVKARLMSGKEASVFVVERHGELLAAKVYKDREQRTFKATAAYTEGRNQTRNSRDKRAMRKRTGYGKELVEASWRDMEYATLQEAFNNGVRVPEPLLLYENVLLMELLVDESGAPAPRLADFDLPVDVAALLHREIYGQVRMLLRCGKIHGDLSAFNILIARDGPTIIDMPQAVDAAGNNSAAAILQRDLANVTEHLARFDARLLLYRDCGAVLWQHYQRGSLEQATEPEQGGLHRTSNRGHKGRRTRDAERGRAGRERPDQRPPPHDRPPHDRPPHARPPHDRPPHDRPSQAPRRGPPPSPRPPQDQRPPRPPQDQRPPRPPQDQRPRPPQDQRPRPPQDQRPRPPQDQRPPRPPQDQRPPRPPQDQRRAPPAQPPAPPKPRPQPEERRGPPPGRKEPQVERLRNGPPRDRHGRH